MGVRASRRAGAEALLQGECRKKDCKIVELEAQLKTSVEERSALKVRYADFESEATQKATQSGKLTGETSMDAKEVKHKVDMIAYQLKASQEERIELLERDLESMKCNVCAAKEDALAARDVADGRDALLLEKDRAITESDLYEALHRPREPSASECE